MSGKSWKKIVRVQAVQAEGQVHGEHFSCRQRGTLVGLEWNDHWLEPQLAEGCSRPRRLEHSAPCRGAAGAKAAAHWKPRQKPFPSARCSSTLSSKLDPSEFAPEDKCLNYATHRAEKRGNMKQRGDNLKVGTSLSTLSSVRKTGLYFCWHWPLFPQELPLVLVFLGHPLSWHDFLKMLRWCILLFFVLFWIFIMTCGGSISQHLVGIGSGGRRQGSLYQIWFAIRHPLWVGILLSEVWPSLSDLPSLS